MNNMELFIKYEQDVMSEKEKEKFEKKLRTSIDFQQEFKLYKKKLNSLSASVDLDEQYFINLLPNVRNKIDQQKLFQPFKKLVYAFPVIFLAIFLTFQFGNNKSSSFEYNFDEWFNEFTIEDEVMSELFTDVLSSVEVYYLMENNLQQYGVEDLDELMSVENQNENLESYIYENAVDEDFIQEFSEEQLNEVYSILINKKF